MKLYKYLILSIVAASSFSSCLDEEPLYSQNNTVVFSSDSGAELALLGCYAYMTSTSAYGQHFQEIPVSGAGFSWSQRNGSDGIVSLQSLSSDGLISTTWNGMYKVISETNAFLANTDKFVQEIRNTQKLDSQTLATIASHTAYIVLIYDLMEDLKLNGIQLK